MENSIDLLQQRADVTILKNEALKEKRRLTAKQSTLGILKSSLAENKDEISGGLTAVNQQVTTMAAVVSSLPEGPSKEDFAIKLKKLEYRQFLLQNRAKTKGLVPVIQYEHDLTIIESTLAVIDDFIAALDARFAALPA